MIESIFRLAKRVLGRFFQALVGELPDIAEGLAENWRKEEPDIARDELVKQIGRHVFGMGQLTSFIITKYVSGSVAHDLIVPICHDVAENMDALPSRFFDLGVSLEKPGYIDLDRLRKMTLLTADNTFGLTLLRMMVVHHMYLFNVHYKVKQAACAELGLDQPKGALNQDQKRLHGPPHHQGRRS